jgi:hypothetical protein
MKGSMVGTVGTVSVSEDDSRHGGFALIDLGRKIPRSSIMLSFRRLNAEPRYLGQDGWQPELCWLEPDHVDQSGPSTIVRVGPRVVDQILELDPIEITIRGEHNALGIVHWPALTPSPRGLITDVGICPPEQKDTPIIKESPPEHAEPEGLLEALSRMPGSTPFDEKRVVQADTTVTAPSRASKPGEHPSSETFQRSGQIPIGSGQRRELPGKQQTRKSKFALGIALASLLVLIAIGGALLLAPMLKSTLPEARRNPTREEMQRRLKDFTERRASASDFEKLGQDALLYGYCLIARDSFEEADPGQSTEASWQLARMYDPRLSGNCVQPNVGWAIRYYNMGAKKGSNRHTKELEALCKNNGSVILGDDGLRQICS